jgi:hypothetical protein
VLQYGSQNYTVTHPTSNSDCGCTENNFDFSPRVGLAYQLTQKTVIRAGFGTYYGQPDLPDQIERFASSPPAANLISFSSDQLFHPALIVSQGFPAGLFPVTTLAADSALQVNQTTRPDLNTLDWFVDVQRQIPGQIVVTASYLGSGVRQIAWDDNLNTPFLPGPGTLQQRRPWPFFGAVTEYAPGATSNYDGLALKAEKRYSNGLVLITSYTWSHTLTDYTLNFGDGTLPVRDPYNLKLDYGNAPYDLRQAFVSSFNYDLPFGKGKHWLNHGGPADWFFGGWQLGGILTLQSGPYFTPTLSVDLANTGSTDFPNLVANPNLSSGRSIHDWFNLAAFALPQQYTFGNAGRAVVEAPGVQNMDIKIGKTFPIRERFRLDFRAEMFNFTNTPHFGVPNSTINSPQDGTITTTTGNPRQIQFALKLLF